MGILSLNLEAVFQESGMDEGVAWVVVLWVLLLWESFSPGIPTAPCSVSFPLPGQVSVPLSVR